MKNSAKAIVVKIMVTVLIISMASAFSACKKKSKVPTKEEFLNEHINDPDPHGVKKLDFNREDLIKATGKVDESEMPALQEQEKYIREKYTGEQ